MQAGMTARSLTRINISDSKTELSEAALREYERTYSLPQRVGPPRLNVTTARLYEFYERVVVLEVVQNALGFPIPASKAGARSQNSAWREYLAKLSWLCDGVNGGDLTASIGVERLVDGPKYWLALNFDPDRKGLTHLEKVLKLVSSLATSFPNMEDIADGDHRPRDVSHPEDVLKQLSNSTISPLRTEEAVFDEIMNASLQFSHKKFKNYCSELSKSMHYAAKTFNTLSEHSDDDSPEKKLLADLEGLNLRNYSSANATLVCAFVSEYRQSQTLKAVYYKHRNKAPGESGSAWWSICHFIGRLTSWERAIKSIINFVKSHPEVVKNFQCDSIDAPHFSRIQPPPADRRTNLDGAFRGIFSKEEDRAMKALTSLRSAVAPFGTDLDKKFAEKYEDTALRPRDHSEMLVHNHFTTNGIKFFYDDKYVGSSKPSCYLCNLYFKLEGKIETRPTHGNMYHNWCLPPGLMEDDREKLDFEAKYLVGDMSKRIQLDILELIESELPRRRRMKDSTTGLLTAPSLRAFMML